MSSRTPFATFTYNSDPSISRLNCGCRPTVDFITVWVTDENSELPGSSDADQIRLPLESDGTYDFNVNWGDGNDDDITAWDDAALTHTYASVGTYEVTIAGTIIGFNFNNSGDRFKLKTISQWGSLHLGNNPNHFKFCARLDVTATDAPTVGTTLRSTFDTCILLTSIGGDWDVSTVTTFEQMFKSTSNFNEDISSWDVTGVDNINDMRSMFHVATAFNQDISSWDVSNVRSMESMFQQATAFNQNISGWNTSSVTTIKSMFQLNSIFNQDISTWDMSNCLDMSRVFNGAILFNQDLGNSGWDVSSVTNMFAMFSGASAFNGDLSAWDVGNVADFSSMFNRAFAFNQILTGWTFKSTGTVSCGSMFRSATAFNQSINSWNMAQVDTVGDMFRDATSFNQPLDNWVTGSFDDFIGMFSGATSFDQDLSNWDVTAVFGGAASMFAGVTLSTANYNALLQGWANQLGVVSGIAFDGGNSQHSGVGTVARNILTNNPHNWTITDGGPA